MPSSFPFPKKRKRRKNREYPFGIETAQSFIVSTEKNPIQQAEEEQEGLGKEKIQLFQ